jgi:hypothetical protein
MKRTITFEKDIINIYTFIEAQQEFCTRAGMAPTQVTINQAHKKSLIKEAEDNQAASTSDGYLASYKMTVNWSTDIQLNKLEFSAEQ